MRALESNSQKSDLTCEDDGLKSWRQVLGFVVADISLNPLYANNEAITILTYPGPPAESIVDVFRKKLRPVLSNARGTRTKRNGAHAITTLKSGR
jgi:hypothetical protein